MLEQHFIIGILLWWIWGSCQHEQVVFFLDWKQTTWVYDLKHSKRKELWFSLWMVKRSGWWWGCAFWGLSPWLLGLHRTRLMESQVPPGVEQLGCPDKGMTRGWKPSLKWSASFEIRGCLRSCRVKCCLLEFCKDQLIKGAGQVAQGEISNQRFCCRSLTLTVIENCAL